MTTVTDAEITELLVQVGWDVERPANRERARSWLEQRQREEFGTDGDVPSG